MRTKKQFAEYRRKKHKNRRRRKLSITFTFTEQTDSIGNFVNEWCYFIQT